MRRITNYIKLLRPKHMIKNILIWFPLVFNGSLFDATKLASVFIGFFSFSLTASAVYVINDIQDAPKDRLHPKKQERPIASGMVSAREGGCLAASCILIALLIDYFAAASPASFICLISYLIINIFYSNGLKNIPILDVVILTSGFVIRLIYGGVISRIEISGWLYLTLISASFYMGLGKRRNEMKMLGEGNETRTVMKYYNYAFLDKNMYMCLGMAEVFYALWAIDQKQDIMMWTIPMVIVMGMKYSLNVEGDSDGDPVELITHDKILWVLAVLYALMVMVAIYLY